MDQAKALQENLSMLRKLAGWSAQDLADMLGVSRQTIAGLENPSRTRMSQIQYIAIRTLLGARVVELRDEGRKFEMAHGAIHEARMTLAEICKYTEVSEGEEGALQPATANGSLEAAGECGTETEKMKSRLQTVLDNLRLVADTLEELETTQTEEISSRINEVCGHIENYLRLPVETMDKTVCELLREPNNPDQILEEAAHSLKRKYENTTMLERTLRIVDQASDTELDLRGIRSTVEKATRGRSAGSGVLGWMAANALSGSWQSVLTGAVLGSVLGPLGAITGAAIGAGVNRGEGVRREDIWKDEDPFAFSAALTAKHRVKSNAEAAEPVRGRVEENHWEDE